MENEKDDAMVLEKQEKDEAAPQDAAPVTSNGDDMSTLCSKLFTKFLFFLI